MSDAPAGSPPAAPPPIEIRGLEMRYGPRLIQRDLNLVVRPREILCLVGGSGCGKSTLLRHLVGLREPHAGSIRLFGEELVGAPEPVRERLQRRLGVTFQQGALFGSLTLAENVALPLEEFTELPRREIAEIVRYKLALVGLDGAGTLYPSEISGGMRKRAALARAMALDPEVLLFDEPSAGLDPLTSRRLDELIVGLRDALGATIVLVTHELDSIFAVGDRAAFLDARRKTLTALGPPRELRDRAEDPGVREFLNRGEDSSSGLPPVAPSRHPAAPPLP